MSNKAARVCVGGYCRVIAIGVFSVIALGAATSQPATQPARRIDLLAMGDWGEGAPAQKEVADALSQYVKPKDFPFAAMLLCGDNFYVNLSGVKDPQWQTLFEQMYDPQVLKMPFYAVLGNHDYDAGKDVIEMDYSRLNPQSRFKMPGRWYRIDLPAGPDPMVSVLMLDSDRPKLSEAQWNSQIQWLDQELAKPRGTWTICCAHHPLFSNGFAQGNGVLQHDWGVLFKKYKVDFYLCGHEHNLQHLDIPDWFTDFVMAGGGGAHSHPLLRDKQGPFSRSIYGFVHFELTPDYAVVSYIGTDDKPVHVYKRLKSGETTVLQTTQSDPGAKNPLEILQGIYGRTRGAETQPTQPTSQP
jgi:tartrate-resistant acid phosphatase type 5